MKPRTFMITLISVVALCTLLTIGHFVYDVQAYQHCSIIYFISKEIW